MLGLDDVLYRWIFLANRRREDLDLPPGLIEDGVSILRTMFGPEYLDKLLIRDASRLAVLDKESNPLRRWLHSGRIDDHILNVLELSSYLRAFRDDEFLPDKVEKMKRDRFWPIFFELAMATRLKRVCKAGQNVVLNAESNESIGDFTIELSAFNVPCECSRLGNSPHITEPTILLERIFHHIEDKTKNILIPLCIKIRSQLPLTGHTYNSVLQLTRIALRGARARQLPIQRSDGQTTVSIELLTSRSEGVDKAADWDGGVRLHAVRAKSHAEVSEKYDRGEELERFEMVRLFVKFAKTRHQSDHYNRLTTKLQKKLRQTRISDRHMGKIVFIEVPFSLRKIDDDKLKLAVHAAAIHSRTALSIVLADREANPQTRYHYSQSATFNQTALRTGKPEIVELVDFLNCAFQSELTLDPILGLPYRRNWSEALANQRRRKSK